MQNVIEVYKVNDKTELCCERWLIVYEKSKQEIMTRTIDVGESTITVGDMRVSSGV